MFALEIVHPLKLLMHGLELSLNVIALGKSTERCQRKLEMVLGVN